MFITAIFCPAVENRWDRFVSVLSHVPLSQKKIVQRSLAKIPESAFRTQKVVKDRRPRAARSFDIFYHLLDRVVAFSSSKGELNCRGAAKPLRTFRHAQRKLQNRRSDPDFAHPGPEHHREIRLPGLRGAFKFSARATIEKAARAESQVTRTACREDLEASTRLSLNPVTEMKRISCRA